MQSYDREVVAPTSIPRRAGKAVKTDRIDASDLAQYYSTGLLTVVAAPDVQLEGDRDLLRSRQDLARQQGMIRKRIQSLLRRSGSHSKAETQHKSHWQKHHFGWFQRTVEACSGSFEVNLLLLFRQIRSLDEILADHGREVEALAVSSRYREPVESLTCYKGIKHLFALAMITEIGDVKRFAHPDK